MTVKEAIEVLKDLRIMDDDCETDCKALDLAIEVLEKVSLIQFNVFALNELLNVGGGTNHDEAEPVRHGRWIDTHFVSGGDFNRCSECGCYIEKTYFANDYNVRYCPACGAKMDGKDINVAAKMGGADNG